jgi:hypothetical protein
MTFDDVRTIALAWPGVEDETSYGTPALKVKGKGLARLREDGETLVVIGVNLDERDMLMEAEPDIFFITDHYRDWPTVLVRLPRAEPDMIKGLLFRRWQAVAPKKLVKAFEETGR